MMRMELLRPRRGDRFACRRLCSRGALWASLFLLSGCMPNAMLIDRATHPKHQDQYARFRTTYYFRVYDYCSQGSQRLIAANALYRFTMTGKAHPLTTGVRFESGTLPKSVIEPFGNTIEYDERSRRFYYQSMEDTQRERRQDEHLDRAKALWEFANELNTIGTQDNKTESAQSTALPTERSQLVQAAVAAARGGLVALAPAQVPNGNSKLPADAGEANAAKKMQETSAPARDANSRSQSPADLSHADIASEKCRQLQRGFQILGPEGWREFRQDERLLLAMSSSGKPLISTLNELSGRVLNNERPSSESLTVNDEITLMRAEANLIRLDAADTAQVIKALETIVAELNKAGDTP